MSSREGNRPALRVLLAFDSFKGSMTAAEACQAAAVRERFGESVEVISTPLADGGEGSLEVLQLDGGLIAVSVDSIDAIGRPRAGEYLFDAERRTAYIEVARSIGLPGVSDTELQPLSASSYGAGLEIADAISRGAERLVVFLGGSATTDGGAGMFQALGARLLDADGKELAPGGAALSQLANVDLDGVRPGTLTAQWVFVADVNAPLLGPTGAAQGCSLQKGASETDVALLETSLAHASRVLEQQTGRSISERPGSGAAGGMQLFPAAFATVEMIAGGPFLSEELGAARAIESADVVFTGEGRFDAQSLDGKVVGTLVRLARQLQTPPVVIVVAGDVAEAARLREAGAMTGISGAFAIAESAAGLAQLQKSAEALVGRKVADLVAVLLAARATGLAPAASR